MASARYGYMTASPSDRPSLKRPHAAHLSASTSTAGTPRAAPPPTTTPTPAQPSGPPSPSAAPRSDDVFVSAPIHDRQSTFVGYFSPSLAPYDLQSLPELASASHRILAYRIPRAAPLSASKKRRVAPQQQTLSSFVVGNASGGGGPREELQTGHDDDGESYGGKSVARALAPSSSSSSSSSGGSGVSDGGTVGSVVVARWYGGVMLGPVRFAHMEAAGRGAVGAWRDAEAARARQEEAAAQEGQGVEDGEGRRVELVAELSARDDSIVSLRGLLAGKKKTLASFEGGGSSIGKDDGGGTAVQVSPGKKLDYGGMTLERLRLLDKARDNTVAFLLKQIDMVEAQIESWVGLMEGVGAEEDDDDGGDVEGGGGEKRNAAKSKATPVGVSSSRR